MLSLNNIEVLYNETVLVLKGLSLEVREGQIVALLGTNGAGKTTTLKAVSGLLEPENGRLSGGSIELFGRPIHRRGAAGIVRDGIFQVMEGRRVFEHLDVEENLLAGAYTRRDRRRVKSDLDRAYAYFPRLAERRRQRAGYLSGGEQQMLAIGRALMTNPTMLLMDEPSEGLAPIILGIIRDTLAEIKGPDLSILLVEQNLGLALAIADRLLIMSEHGHIVWEGTPDELSADEAAMGLHLGV
jgi:branched-chain amino acid transport system ATP-binding protein